MGTLTLSYVNLFHYVRLILHYTRFLIICSAFVIICGTRVIICTLVIICDIFVIICSAFVVVCVGVSLHEVISGSYAVLCFSSLNTVCVLYYDVKRSRDLCKSF